MKRKLTAQLLLAVVAAAALVLPSAATAATNPGGGNGLKISPVRTSLIINPGDSKTISIEVQNVTSMPTELETIVNDFKAQDETGKPDILLNQNSYASSHSLKQFVQPVPNFSLKPGQQKTVKVTLTIPQGTAGGGYYGAVRFLPVGTTNASKQVSVAASVGSLVLLKVPGNINQDLRLISFGVSKDGGSGSFFTSGDSLSAVARFRNYGNLQEAPFGKILVKKGGKQVATYEINNTNPPGNVLPDSTRRFDVPLKDLGWGKYTIEGNFGYGDKGTLLSSQKTIYIIPLWLIITAVIIIILVIIGVILGRKELRRHDRRLLANYRRANRRPGRR